MEKATFGSQLSQIAASEPNPVSSRGLTPLIDTLSDFLDRMIDAKPAIYCLD